MAYRRPGVTVTQEFQGLVPALAAFSLPCVAVGPAYQLVNDDELGTYSAQEQTYGYASLLGGAIVDLEELASDEPFPATKKPISVTLKNPVVEVVSEKTTGEGTDQQFTDPTSQVFANVQAGDLVVIEKETGVTIVGSKTDGETTTAAPNRLLAGTTGDFEDVEAGDTVDVTNGTNTNTGTYTVQTKVDDSTLELDGAVNDGNGPATDVAYSITGDRGGANEGEWPVKEKTDDNTLVLQSPLNEDEAPITYKIHREVEDLELDRVDSHPGNGFLAEEAGVTLPASLQDARGTVPYDVVAADVEASYRALRTDLADDVREFGGIGDIQSVFGQDQISPANPLAFALQTMLQNTVTAVNGLGLTDSFNSSETTAYLEAADVLEMTDMYAIALLTQSVTIATTFKSHVTQLSSKEKERVVTFSSKLVTIGVLQDEAELDDSLSGSRTVVPNQTDGEANSTSPTTLTDTTTDQFLNVQPGDTVTVISGTNVTAGEYKVSSVTDNNNLETETAFITSGSTSDIAYYIQRKDGLESDGKTFYDRNASFISNGVSTGHQLSVLDGQYKGRYEVANVISEKKLELTEPVPGVIEVTTGFSYQMDEDLTKKEQAELVKGFSNSLGSRRVVHTWPDVLEMPVGQSVEEVPGYYLGTAVCALTSGLPTQQGFTRLSVSGFLGFKHSTKYFTPEQMDTMAEGGTMIAVQDGPQQPLYFRHQLTTDTSSIKFQEYSVTKNADFISKFTRDSFKDFIGQWNIVDSTIDEIKTTAQAVNKFLSQTTRIPKFGAVTRSSSLAALKESDTQIDTLVMRFSHNLPIPLNNLDTTLSL